ncbi:MAG TPA: hypothetical protein VH164_01215, partial [Ktedonobacteraceae bacterium]|nr:hypothetical protein [Ktedonobacteraceae bacterium]
MGDQQLPLSSPDEVTDAASGIIAEIRCEHLRDAFGVGGARPRLSLTVKTEIGGWRQLGYEIESYRPDGQIGERTGRIASEQSVLVAWPFAPLSSRERLAI